MNNLHPIFQQALAPFVPAIRAYETTMRPLTVEERREFLNDEYRSGLDRVETMDDVEVSE